MQVVGQLVRLDADEIGADRIDRAPELFRRDIGELFGESVAQFTEMQLPEAPRAADAVLPQPRLRFMRAKGRAADGIEIDDVGGKDRAGEFRRDVLFVHAVPGFVPEREEAAGQPVRAETTGDAHVVAREGDLERMHGIVEPAALEVVAEFLGDLQAKGPLRRNRIVTRQEVGPGWRHRQRLVDQRLQRRLQRIEHAEQLPERHAGLVEPKHGIVGMFVVADRIGDLTLDGENAVEDRRVGGKIVLRPRLGPSRLRDRLQFRRFGNQRGGNARQHVDLGLGLIEGTLPEIVGATADLVARSGDRCLHGDARRQVARHGGQSGNLIAAGHDTARRHLRLRVPTEKIDDAQQVVDPGDLGFELRV